MRYYDFDLLIERAGENFRARVMNSPTGQAVADFALPFSESELKDLLEKIGEPQNRWRRVESPAMKAAKTFGGRLFEAVFDGEIRGRLRSSLEEAERRKRGLRFRLRISSVSEFADLPWEYLYDPHFDNFFSLSVRTPIVRYLELPKPTRPLSIKPPIKILVIISSPHDYPPLKVEQEWAKLNDALAALQNQGLVTLKRLERATIEALQWQLGQEENHIFHFIGHGEFDHDLQDGILLFEDDTRHGVRVNGQRLGMLLNDLPSLRLAILNACNGAQTLRHDHFAGTAQSLVQKGIPAVIAMQFGITDEAAILFAQTFYRILAEGRPIDTALAETRKAIFNQGHEVEWGTPVLYMQSPSGRIFDITPAPNSNGIGAGIVLPSETSTGVPVSNEPAEETAAVSLITYLNAKQNGPAQQEKPLRKRLSPDQEIFRQMYRAQVCLSLLHYLDEISETKQNPSLADLCRTLGIPKPQRQHAYHGLECLAAMRLVDKITAAPFVTWRITAKGHELVKKLSETILIRETKPVG